MVHVARGWHKRKRWELLFDPPYKLFFARSNSSHEFMRLLPIKSDRQQRSDPHDKTEQRRILITQDLIFTQFLISTFNLT